MTYSVPVNWDAMQGIIVSVLREDMESLQQDLQKVCKTGKGFVYSMDPDVDAEHLSDLLSAYRKIIKYYGGEV